jgi:hypothetical protein
MSAERYLTSAEAAEHLRYGSLKAFLNMLSRRRLAGRPITTRRINGRLLFRVVDLDAALTVERARRSSGAAATPDAAPAGGRGARGARV